MLDEKTLEVLRTFIATVESRAELIESHIGSLLADSDAAVGLNRLLECAAEARLLLAERTPS